MRGNWGRRLLPAVVVATGITLSACGKEVVEEDISYADNNAILRICTKMQQSGKRYLPTSAAGSKM